MKHTDRDKSSFSQLINTLEKGEIKTHKYRSIKDIVSIIDKAGSFTAPMKLKGA